MNSLQFLNECRKRNKTFFYCVVLIFVLYVLQLVLRVEITPLGYFSLYSNPCKEQKAYKQILPYNGNSLQPVNIYSARGGAFLMFEILPTRYDILKHSENCNQMSPVLKRLGIQIDLDEDCKKLNDFNRWFRIYAGRQGILLNDSSGLMEYGFKGGKLLEQTEVH